MVGSRVHTAGQLVLSSVTQDGIAATFAYPACLAFLIPDLFRGRVFESSDTHAMAVFWRHGKKKSLIAATVFATALRWDWCSGGPASSGYITWQ